MPVTDLIVVVGARPNFVKVAPIVPALEASGVRARIAHTGQHYDASLSAVFFGELAIPEPSWHLGVGSGTQAVQTGAAMVALEHLFAEERPQAVMVIGDVNSTLAGALAAVKLHIPVVHLEAGLRSHDMRMPEEVNRIVTDRLSSLLLTSISTAQDELLAEGCDPRRIRFVGNVMAETALSTLTRISSVDAAGAHGLAAGGYALATIHRAENLEHPERLAEIVAALNDAPVPVIFPAHPRTGALLSAQGLDQTAGHVMIVPPVGYLEMLALQRDAAVIVTDSGGVQEEACVLHTPCVTIRENTERGITVDVGANRLAQAGRDSIGAAVRGAIGCGRTWPLPERWDTGVSSRVCDALREPLMPL